MGVSWRRQLVVLGSLWAATSLLALIVVGIAWTGWIKAQALRELRAQRRDVVRVLARIADSGAREKLDGLSAIAERLGRDWPALRPRDLQRDLHALRAALQLPTLFVVSPNGVPLAFSPARAPDGSSNLDRRYGDREYLQEAARTQRASVSGILLGRAAQELVIAVALPIRSGGAPVAYLAGTVPLQSAVRALEEAAAHTRGWLALMDRDQRALRVDPASRRLIVEDWSAHPVAAVLKKAEGTAFLTLDHEDALVVHGSIASLGLVIVFVGEVDALLAGERRLFWTVMVTLLASVGVSVTASTVIGRRMLREREND